MPTFNTLYNRYLDLTGDNSTANKTLGKNLINDTQRLVLSDYNWSFMMTSSTATTATSTAAYKLPYNYRKLETVYLTNNNTDYQPEYVGDLRTWRNLNSNTASTTSDIPQYYTIFNNEVQLWPIVQTKGLTLTFQYEKKFRDLKNDDYTTANVATLTAGAAVVTGTSTTSWSGDIFADQRFKVDGDGYWYEIASVDSDTQMTLVTNFGGTSVAAASSKAYTVGDWSPIPEEFHDLLVFRPVAIYYQQRENTALANYYMRQHDELLKSLKDSYSNQRTGNSGKLRGRRREITDPNLDQTAVGLV